MRAEHEDLLARINDTGELSDEDEKALDDAIADMVDDFGPDFDAEGNPLEAGESDRVRAEHEREAPARAAEEAPEAEEEEAEREEVPA
jgi:hypothetical protein